MNSGAFGRWRGRATTIVAGLVLVAACSGDVRLPSPVAAPEDTTAASEAPPTPTTIADTSGCDNDPVGTRNPDSSPARSYAPDGPLPAPADLAANSTMKAIQDNGRLVVGVSADTLLFGARNPETGVIEGFDIDMLKAIARAIFGEGGEAKIEYRVIRYDQRLPELISGGVDLVAHTMTITCRRWQQIAFSSEYFAAGQRVLVKKDSGYDSITDLVDATARVCAPAGSTNLDELTTNPQYAGLVPKLITKPDITDCLVAMQQGEADAASGDDTVLAGFAKQDPNTLVVGEAFTNEPYGIGVSKERPDLVQFVNAVIEQMRTNGEWKALYARWLVPTLAASDAEIPAPPVALYGRPET